MVKVVNWMTEYKAIYLKHWNEVDKAALPYLSKTTTQAISVCFEVNGAATEASASDNEIPTLAVFKAPQSLAPSPHIPTKCLFQVWIWRFLIMSAFSSGCILAKIAALFNIIFINCLDLSETIGSSDSIFFLMNEKAFPVMARTYSYCKLKNGGSRSIKLLECLDGLSEIIFDYSFWATNSAMVLSFGCKVTSSNWAGESTSSHLI